MTLSEQQQLFMKYLGKLIAFTYGRGFALSGGELYRSDEQALIYALSSVDRVRLVTLLDVNGYSELASAIRNNRGTGIRNTLHGNRLAVDLNLFYEGKYLESKGHYQVLGDFWKKQHPLCRWGGDFGVPDVYHFSMEWNGVK